MTHFLIANMAPLMFMALVVGLLIGYPVAFSLGAVGLSFGFLGIQLGLLNFELLQALPKRVIGIMSNDTLLAIPFFTFMGLILERSGMAEDLLDTIGQLFGPLRGGLAYAVIFVGALLAATTGVVAASVISMGLISLPIMLRYGYDRRLASGVIAASGTLAQIIPPSMVLIVMADQLGRSVGDMYKGAFVPGLVLAALYAIYVAIVTWVAPKGAPGLPREAVGFKEAEPRARALLTRSNAVVLIGCAAAAIALFAYNVYADIPALPIGALTADLYQTMAAFFTLLLQAVLIVGLGFFLLKLIRFLMAGNDERGLLSLLLLALVSATFGWFMMRNSGTEGADFVVLSMFYGILFAFGVAVVNWAVDRLTGFRFLSHIAQQTTFVMVPPLFLIFLVLGTIFIGVATPTEGGAMGASGALILGALKRRLAGELIPQAVEASAKLSAFVVFILLGARVFSLTFYGVSGHIWVENLLTDRKSTRLNSSHIPLSR